MKTMKFIITLLTGMALAGVASHALAADAKEVTITGDMVCGKCTLHETKSCQNVVQVKKDDKTVKYYLVQNDVSKAEHGAVCHGDTEKVKVTGTVEEKDGKEIMTPTKIEVIKP